ncbi:MAG: cell division protein SepF [Microbacteriaceae bacterium]|nr:cell division protein SepF [Microbacteriaceae bacterium]MCI1207404.1 cell division protein SepF [Microbacteriaceae bacterium]
MANPLRKTLEYLGLVEEGEEPVAEAPRRQAPQAAPAPRANVTPIRRAAVRPAAAGELSEILTVHPKKYSDVQAIADSFRENIPVIINLSQMSEPDARRLIDFAAGLASGLLGKIERVTPKVFLLSPQNVLVSGDPSESRATEGTGFFVEN